MPVVHFHLTDATAEQEQRLIREGSERLAGALGVPVERIRMFVHHLAPASVAVGGVTVAESGLHAPFFVLQLLEGRPVDVRHRALAEVTDVIVDVFGADRANVRGLIARIDPDDWVIGGVPVSVARAGSAPSGRP